LPHRRRLAILPPVSVTNEDAMRAYLQRETELPEEIAAEELSGLRLVAR
jgi:hypothetical protein